MVSSVRKLLLGTLVGAVTASLGVSFNPAPTHAEGSRNLYPASLPPEQGPFRANIEWRANTQYAGIVTRRTLFRVYANAGENILLGSSAVGVPGTNGSVGDIRVYNPGLVNGLSPNDLDAIGQENVPTTPSFSCNTQQPGRGQITTRAQELAGPQAITGGGNPAGYIPCFYTAPTTGIYTVVITGPLGFSPDPSPAVSDIPPQSPIDAFQTGPDQGQAIAAWDVTVRSSATTSTTDFTGRLFTYYLALFTGNNGRPLDSTVFIQTLDGFLYRTEFDGIDPNGFIIFGNRAGFSNSGNFNPDTPLEHNVIAVPPGNLDQLETLQGGVTLVKPQFPIFFTNPTGSPAISALQIPAPRIPTLSNFSFRGTAGSNNSRFGTGGTFRYRANIDHDYELVISRDGVNFSPNEPLNRALRGRNQPGDASIAWDGLDNSGNPFPVGRNYQSRLLIRAGLYHFPLLDVENAARGTPIITLLNAPGPGCLIDSRCTGALYDDRGYRTFNGTIVGPGINQPLEGAPTPNTTVPNGFDTTDPGIRAFTGFGDKKGLDLWTFFPSNAIDTPLNIIDAPGQVDLIVSKSVDAPVVPVGQNATFTITITNNPDIDRASNATGVQVRDPIPSGTSFVSATPSQGTYDPATGLWNVGALAVGASATLQLTVQVNTITPVTNSAELSDSDQPDIDDSNNRDSARINAPNLRLVKRITAIVRGDNPATRFTNFVNDPTDADDTAAGWQQANFIPVGLVDLTDNPLNSGDQVEYTVYFLSDGAAPILDANICDQIDARTTLVSNTNQVLRNPNPIASGGELFQPLAPLPSGNACRSQSNPNGSAVFSLGTIPATPNTNVGFVRFRVRVK